MLNNPNANQISLNNLKPLNPRLLYPYLDNATTLDPKFSAPYEYGAIVLPSIDKNQAIKIAKKGIANNPDNWKLYQQLGYIYWRSENYEEASKAYGEGAKVKDAPAFMSMMKARVKTQGGSRETARIVYEQLLQSTNDERTKEAVKLRIKELDYLNELDALNKLLSSYREKNNRCVKSLKTIIPFLSQIKLPSGKNFHMDQNGNLVDPTGAPYLLDLEKCVVLLNKTETKLPY